MERFTILVGIQPRKMLYHFLWQWGIGLDNAKLIKIFPMKCEPEPKLELALAAEISVKNFVFLI